MCDVRMFCTFVSFFIRYNDFPVSILIIWILLLFSIALSITSAMQQEFCSFFVASLALFAFILLSLCYSNEIVHKLCKNIHILCIFAFMIFIVNFILINSSACEIAESKPNPMFRRCRCFPFSHFSFSAIQLSSQSSSVQSI